MPHIQIYLCFNTLILQQGKALPPHAEQNSTEERRILPYQAELYLGRLWAAESWLHLRARLHPVLGWILKDSQNESWHSPGRCEWPLSLCYRKKNNCTILLCPHHTFLQWHPDLVLLCPPCILSPLQSKKAFYSGVARVIQKHNRLSSPFVPWYNEIWPSK